MTAQQKGVCIGFLFYLIGLAMDACEIYSFVPNLKSKRQKLIILSIAIRIIGALTVLANMIEIREMFWF